MLKNNLSLLSPENMSIDQNSLNPSPRQENKSHSKIFDNGAVAAVGTGTVTGYGN